MVPDGGQLRRPANPGYYRPSDTRPARGFRRAIRRGPWNRTRPSHCLSCVAGPTNENEALVGKSEKFARVPSIGNQQQSGTPATRKTCHSPHVRPWLAAGRSTVVASSLCRYGGGIENTARHPLMWGSNGPPEAHPIFFHHVAQGMWHKSARSSRRRPRRNGFRAACGDALSARVTGAGDPIIPPRQARSGGNSWGNHPFGRCAQFVAFLFPEEGPRDGYDAFPRRRWEPWTPRCRPRGDAGRTARPQSANWPHV